MPPTPRPGSSRVFRSKMIFSIVVRFERNAITASYISCLRRKYWASLSMKRSTNATAEVRRSSRPSRTPITLTSSPASGNSSLKVRELMNCSVSRTRRSVSVIGQYPTAADVSLAPMVDRLKMSTSSADPGLISNWYVICGPSIVSGPPGSTNRRFSRSQFFAVRIAISRIGTSRPLSPSVARSPKMSFIGSRTIPPPNRTSASPATRKALSMLWWRIRPNWLTYSLLSSIDTRSIMASQIESGWPIPLRSTISTCNSLTGIPCRVSTRMLHIWFSPVFSLYTITCVRRCLIPVGNLCLPSSLRRFGVPAGGNLCLPSALRRFGVPGGGNLCLPSPEVWRSGRGENFLPGPRRGRLSPPLPAGEDPGQRHAAREPANVRPPGDAARRGNPERGQPRGQLQEHPHRQKQHRGHPHEPHEHEQQPDEQLHPRSRVQQQVGAEDPGDRAAGADRRLGRQRIGEHMDEARDRAADEVENEERAVPHRILDVVREDPQAQHVAEEVRPASVQEQARPQPDRERRGRGDRDPGDLRRNHPG